MAEMLYWLMRFTSPQQFGLVTLNVRAGIGLFGALVSSLLLFDPTYGK